tara:strand:- start:3110 stop:3712 length:603 start_codon:yes stop_codon:yes gene_type:complete
MANSKSTAKTVTVEGTSMDALVKEGKALGSIWRQVNSLKQTIKENGFDTRLGKLLQQLKSNCGSSKIPTHVLRTHGIAAIDRRRRSEALWFIENETECREYIAKAKYKGSSLTALQAAMRKATKGSEETTTEGETQTETTEGETSNVGQSQPPQQKITHTVMVNTIVKQAHFHGLDLEEIIEDLMIVLENREKHNAKAAA